MQAEKEKLQVVDPAKKKTLAMSAHVAYTLNPVKRKTYHTRDVIAMLKRQQGERSLRQFAADLGISAAYLSDIYRGNRRPGKVVLHSLGLAQKIEPAEPVYVAV